MPCPKCRGCIEEVQEREPIEGLEMAVEKCLNCGYRAYHPFYNPTIQVVKGQYYHRGDW